MKKVWAVVGYFTGIKHYVFDSRDEAEKMADILNDENYDEDFFEILEIKAD